jgi:phage protein D
MPTTQHIAQVYLTIDGAPLDTKYMDNLISVEVDDSLYLPDMFTIRLKDPDMAALQADVFKPGKAVKIEIRPPGAPTDNAATPPHTTLMTGEITSLEPELNSIDRVVLTARGYDRSHRLHRERKTATYKQVTDSDLANQLAGSAGLSANVTATTVVYPFLMQANQTNWEFLMERAKRINYRLYVEDRTLYFKPPPAAPPETSMEWGIDLAEFRARLSTVNQVSEVTVRGWDPGAKAPIVGQASSAASPVQNGIGQTGGAAARAAHSVTGKSMIVDQPVYNQSEATKMAQALLDKLSESFIEAEGQCAGLPAVQAGSRVNVTGVGTKFNGKYLVTRALHHYSQDGFTTRFWCSGGNGSMTITDLLRGAHQKNGNPNASPRWTAGGVMVGIVTNNKDEEDRGRVKVKFPALGDNVESYWCRLASTMAGPTRGIAMLPEANDEVVVAFVNGDPNHGVVIGSVWNGSDKLPKPLGQLVTGGATIRRVIKSRKGHEILIDDTEEPGGFVIVDMTGDNKIVINTKENLIQVLAKNNIEITSAQGDISITATTGAINIKAQKAIAITSDTDKITAQAMNNVDISSRTAKVTAAGLTGVDITSQTGKVTASGTTGVDLSSNAGKVSITGTLGVDVNGVTQVNIKGLLINLN